jgi:hypothetical protein
MEGELRDDWALIAPLLPPPKQRGRPWARSVHCQWHSLGLALRCQVARSPQGVWRPSTCHRRLQEWQDQGIWEHIWLTFLGALDLQGKLDWSQAFLDGSFVPGKKGERSSTYTYGVVSKATLFDTYSHSPSAPVSQLYPHVLLSPSP